MSDVAIEFDDCQVLLVERVAVLGPAVPPRSCLSTTRREAVRSFDIADVAVLKHRVNACQVRAEQLS
jgi:hypothetical protein